MKKVAIFDIDGTIFRSSLFVELTEALIDAGFFPEAARKTYAAAYRRWAERKGPYNDYKDAIVKSFDRHITDVRQKDFARTAKRVVAERQDRVYRYTRDLVAKLHRQGYFLLAISNSPREMVEPFCKHLGFDKIYGWMYEAGPDGKFTGQVLYADLIVDKAKILKRAVAKEGLTLRGSIGVGDTDSDIAFLSLVDHPVCFNPNKELYNAAKRRGWEVVVERKDVIYHL